MPVAFTRRGRRVWATIKTASPSQVVLAGARQLKTTCLPLRRSTVFGIIFGLVFHGLRHRVGFQLVGFSVELDRSESYLHFLALDLDHTADHFRALGNHGLSLDLDGCGELRGKGITDVVLVAG